MITTCIRNAEWVVAWDEETAQQTYLRNVDVVFSGNEIAHVGPDYRGPADRVIAGDGICVMPGLVNVHSHLRKENLGRGLIEELGNPNLYMSGIFDAKAPYVTAPLSEHVGGWPVQFKANLLGTQSAVAELLLSGCTTIVDLEVPYDGWLEILADTGIRAYAAAMFREADWSVRNGCALEYHWDLERGRKAFDLALKTVDAARAHSSGRLDGMVAPAQVDTCTPEILKESLAAARHRGMKMTAHCAQGVSEFQEMVRRHGKTAVQWLFEHELLGPDTLLGHAVFLDHHSWVNWWTRRDLDILAETGTCVAHCPVVFSRYGQMMEDVGKYIRKGITLGIGTDTEPHNMIEEIRTAAILGKTAARNIHGVWASEIFHAATIGGAKALGRTDIGRIAPGAKADIVILDINDASMRPIRDPLRSLIFSAADRGVRDVFVDGIQVVANREVLTIDRQKVTGEIQESQDAYVRNTPYVDFQGRSADELTPLCLPVVNQGINVARRAPAD